ncbi:MAG: trehalose-phosphatase [Acidothermus sp.]|nr:trehalose-phosphatase [Acidothermus sp.]
MIALDFDGTLSPIAPTPEAAVVHPDAPDVLSRLASRVRALAVVTGRAPLDAARLLGWVDAEGRVAPCVRPTMIVLGHYGLQRWSARGGLSEVDVGDGIRRARALLPDLLRRLPAPPGTRVEDKGIAIAVHVRRTPDPPAALEALRDPLESLAKECGLRLEAGRMVWELRLHGADKGEAVRGLISELRPGAVVYAGDDWADLVAFHALDRVGVPTLRICSASAEVPELRAHADLVVNGPDGVVAWLADLAAALENRELRSDADSAR